MQVLLVFWLLGVLLRVSQAQMQNKSLEWTPRSLGRLLQQCLIGTEVWQCLGSQTERLLDAANQDNSTWKLSEYLSIEPQERESEQQARHSEGLAGKLLDLTQGRAIRLRMPRQLTISNALDGFGNELSLEQGRKKKDKDKNMAMMGGMIMLATLAQMFLGKVILIAGSAFIMAKIALVISLLGSLKKGSAGHSGSPTEHVIVTSAGHSGGHGGGHSHERGWHRSMPNHHYSAAPPVTHTEVESHPEHEQAYHAYELERIGRRQILNEATKKPGFL